jgi:hypothetical protein
LESARRKFEAPLHRLGSRTPGRAGNAVRIQRLDDERFRIPSPWILEVHLHGRFVVTLPEGRQDDL